MLEGGSLLIASNAGVCHVAGTLNSLPKTQMAQLIQVLENKELLINQQKNTQKKLKTHNKNLTNPIRYDIENSENELLEFNFDDLKINCNIWSHFEEFFKYADSGISNWNKKLDSIVEFVENITFNFYQIFFSDIFFII